MNYVGVLIEFVLLSLAHAAAGIYSSTLKYSKKVTYIIWGVWVVIQSSLLFCTEFVMSHVAMRFFVGFILSLISQYVIFFITTKGRITQRIFTMLTYSILFCIVMTLFTIVKSTFTNMHPLLIALIFATVLFGVLCYFLCFVCKLYRTAAKNITTGWGPLIIVNTVFLINVIFSSVFPTRLTTFSDPTFVTFIFMCVSIMAVYPVVFSSINSMSDAAKKREVESQNNLLLAQIQAENIRYAADSQARHDRRHHNLVMLEFANNNDIENVREYLKNLVESDSGVIGEVRYCENMTVGTVLTVYERRANENGVSVKISANVSRDINVLPQDLVIIIANLFENAINATAKLKTDDKCINIYIKEKAQRLLIRVENPCRVKLNFDESYYGVGISSIIATTNKYDGMYDFNAEDGIFSAKVSLNLK